jgi:hypothetical protein
MILYSYTLFHLEDVVPPGSKIEVKPLGLQFVAVPVLRGNAAEIAQSPLLAAKVGER